MKEFIDANGGAMASILMVLVMFNLTMTGLRSALEKIKDKTKTKVDNKAYDILTKVLGLTESAVDWLSGNKEHKKDV